MEELASRKARNRTLHWFILPLLLGTPTIQFSLDRKLRRHKQNQCSASDSVGLIFTRSYRSTFLITTPTTTLSLNVSRIRACKRTTATAFLCLNPFVCSSQLFTEVDLNSGAGYSQSHGCTHAGAQKFTRYGNSDDQLRKNEVK